ncbi:unnamed protein product [Haemonchus placei]|uniref:Secreted protein n=1 Tax=Haemonchus placei TaxID=6290 RepID=A0A0N4VSP6_HAEPC|nr:unnamed protein product [Haemonchus placei]
MHFAVILLVVVTAVYCQLPGWTPSLGIGPIINVCSVQGSTTSCNWKQFLKRTPNSPTGVDFRDLVEKDPQVWERGEKNNQVYLEPAPYMVLIS